MFFNMDLDDIITTPEINPNNFQSNSFLMNFSSSTESTSPLSVADFSCQFPDTPVRVTRNTRRNIFENSVTPSPNKNNERLMATSNDITTYYKLFPETNRSGASILDYGFNLTGQRKKQLPYPPSFVDRIKEATSEVMTMDTVQSSSSINDFSSSLDLYYSLPPVNSLTGNSLEICRPVKSYEEKSCSESLRPTLCTFCRKNGETPLVYMAHKLKERVGKRNVVTCPILRSHVCPTCRATGDEAHTITYCPMEMNYNHGFSIPSTTITLKNTRLKSNGKKRF